MDRKNGLHYSSRAAGQPAAGILSLIETAKLNDIEPQAYLTDVLTRLPTHPHSRIEELLATIWQPKPNASAYWPVYRVQQIAKRDRRALPPHFQKPKLLGPG
ncbi:MAG: transposase domain-containing protein [Rhodoferax sp.]|nr:transposase domain-containing protein [Rhodoferax sp.]